MRKLLIALVLTTALCLGLAAVAAADPGSVQDSGQTATTSQGAGAASGATQIDPSNTNISIRVLSPGDDGDVSQSNTAASSASAGNQAGTTQTADQGTGGSGIQTSQQQSTTDQLAFALSAAAQVGATNVNSPVRVLSPGSNGDVSQSNTAGSQATAGNAATTDQTASQGQSGSSCGCSGSEPAIQTSKQSAGTEQGAGAASSATQDRPSNTNVSIRVLSPGGNGSVSQANTAGSSATAGNSASTTQNAGQSSGGPVVLAPTTSSSAPATSDAATPSAAPAAAPATTQSNTAGSSAGAGNQAATTQGSSQSGSGSPIQVGDQSATTGQLAGAYSQAEQVDPSNTAGSIRVLSPGDDGSVSQSNTVGSSASAGNSAGTTQGSTQSASGSCGCGSSSPIQVAGQQASTGQGALAASAAEQDGASNTASPVRVLSPGSGGDVSQSNTVGSSATAGNAATTTQSSAQDAGDGHCGCGGSPIQVAGQKADTDQGSLALSKAVQAFGGREGCGCGSGGSGNDASPVRVWSPGSDGDVTQSNTVGSSAASGNTATTTQDGTQAAGGSAIQVAGQEADTGQLSFAASLAAQLGASNTADPVRVKSPGGGGSVSQQNTAGSSATSGNAATTGQGVTQSTGEACGCSSGTPIQVLGQQAGTGQFSAALSGALQLYPSNTDSPVRVWSGDGRRELMPAT
jgi:hypothetical protein